MDALDFLYSDDDQLKYRTETERAEPPMPIIKRKLRPKLHGRKHGNILHMSRNVKHMSQTELADTAGLSRQAIDSIENNRSAPSVYTALAIAQVLEMSVEDIFKLHEK